MQNVRKSSFSQSFEDGDHTKRVFYTEEVGFGIIESLGSVAAVKLNFTDAYNKKYGFRLESGVKASCYIMDDEAAQQMVRQAIEDLKKLNA